MSKSIRIYIKYFNNFKSCNNEQLMFYWREYKKFVDFSQKFLSISRVSFKLLFHDESLLWEWKKKH